MTCACGYDRPPTVGLFSVEDESAHRDAHLAAFPGSDAVTRANLDNAVASAAGSAGRLL